MFRVKGYRDLRPIDWMSGKRMPLAPGEGHICDRCGAEHAVVYEVRDEETGKEYAVGSSCAKKQFGFEFTQDKEAKKLVKTAKAEEADRVDAARQVAVRQAAAEVAQAVSRMQPPAPVADSVRYPGAVAWRVGDGIALAAHGRTDDEAVAMARQDWYEKRIMELIPTEWDKITLLLHPGDRSKHTTSMRRRARDLALKQIR